MIFVNIIQGFIILSYNIFKFKNFFRAEKIKIKELGLTIEDEKCWVDLNSFLHISPHRVPLKTSLDSIFRLFRGLGLRFLIVVNDENKVSF